MQQINTSFFLGLVIWVRFHVWFPSDSIWSVLGHSSRWSLKTNFFWGRHLTLDVMDNSLATTKYPTSSINKNVLWKISCHNSVIKVSVAGMSVRSSRTLCVWRQDKAIIVPMAVVLSSTPSEFTVCLHDALLQYSFFWLPFRQSIMDLNLVFVLHGHW